MTEKYKHVAPWKPEEDHYGSADSDLFMTLKILALLVGVGFAGWALFQAFIVPIAKIFY